MSKTVTFTIEDLGTISLYENKGSEHRPHSVLVESRATENHEDRLLGLICDIRRDLITGNPSLEMSESTIDGKTESFIIKDTGNIKQNLCDEFYVIASDLAKSQGLRLSPQAILGYRPDSCENIR